MSRKLTKFFSYSDGFGFPFHKSAKEKDPGRLLDLVTSGAALQAAAAEISKAQQQQREREREASPPTPPPPQQRTHAQPPPPPPPPLQLISQDNRFEHSS